MKIKLGWMGMLFKSKAERERLRLSKQVLDTFSDRYTKKGIEQLNEILKKLTQ
jgi:hypothetical protein